MNEPFFRAAVHPALQQQFDDPTWQRETLAGKEAEKARKAVKFNLENLLKDRGSVAPGMMADLVVLDADPSQDIRNTRSIHAVWKRGVQVGG